MSKNKMITILAEIDQKVSNCDQIEPVVDKPMGNRAISSTDIDDKMLISFLRADKNILRQIISFEVCFSLRRLLMLKIYKRFSRVKISILTRKD